MLYKQPRPDDVLVAHGRATQPALPRRFTVCVWNWQKSKQKGWADEFAKISQAADLFLAQEVRRSPAVRGVMEAAPYHWSGAVSFFSLKGQNPVGVATGCTAEPLKVSFKRGAREPVLQVPKMTLSTLIPLQHSAPLLVINIHAINFTGLKPFESNLRRAAELLLDFDGPVLLGGDFNSWNARRRRLLQSTARAAGLTEVVFDPDRRTRCLGRPVDYLFVRGLKVLAAGVRATEGSDHNPLLARLEAR
ncbi:endonuclease/exonuclease/phosphatase family protein [Candidatus Avelusimicrobium alvi]|uniref:endonuclease/exonuclease/phosphatase family protein n=1 Tax=Candidatus Avelusimicrobium alvi TaxID=3416221 RepID=UPI003D14E8FB